MTKGFSGKCLCGAVSYQSTSDPMLSAHCYCVDCRKTSGTGHGTHVVTKQDSASITGQLAAYDHPADSGNVVSRNFCPTCGSPIYSTNSAMPGMIFFRASSLDDLEIIQPAMAVYTDRAPSWDIRDDKLTSFAEGATGGPEKVIAELD